MYSYLPEMAWYTGLPLFRLSPGFSIKLYMPSTDVPAKVTSEQGQLKVGAVGDGGKPMMLSAVSIEPLRSALARVASVKSMVEGA